MCPRPQTKPWRRRRQTPYRNSSQARINTELASSVSNLNITSSSRPARKIPKRDLSGIEQTRADVESLATYTCATRPAAGGMRLIVDLSILKCGEHTLSHVNSGKIRADGHVRVANAIVPAAVPQSCERSRNGRSALAETGAAARARYGSQRSAIGIFYSQKISPQLILSGPQ